MDLDAIEREYLDRIDRAGETIGTALGVPDIGPIFRAECQPIVHRATQALGDAIAAGDTPEQFAARLEALKES